MLLRSPERVLGISLGGEREIEEALSRKPVEERSSRKKAKAEEEISAIDRYCMDNSMLSTHFAC